MVLPVLSALLLLSLAAVAVLVHKRAAAAAGDSDEELSRAVRRLRERLHITARDGFLLGAERPPLACWWAQRPAVVWLRKAHVEAAAQLDMQHDFDPHLVDALCLCLRSDEPAGEPPTAPSGSRLPLQAEGAAGMSEQRASVHEWLLGLARDLLDPSAVANRRPPFRGEGRDSARNIFLGSDLVLDVLPRLRSSSLAGGGSGQQKRNIPRGIVPGSAACSGSARERFSYLESKVSDCQ